MLNTYKVTPKVDASSTHHHNLNFNAVSGTLCKSHPKSVFAWFHKDSPVGEKMMGPCPTYRFDFEKRANRTSRCGYGYEETRYEYVNGEEPVVVLQVMLTGEDNVIAEIVRADDFYEPPTEEAPC